MVSCSHSLSPQLEESELDRGWPATTLFWRPKTSLPANWREGKQLWSPRQMPVQRTALPLLPNASLAGLDAQCLLCHETYVTAFSSNVHRREGCESCHGPASRHIATRGEGADSILSLTKWELATPSGRRTTPAERAEVCLRCHESDPPAFGQAWRTSAHAYQQLTCGDCHNAHYNVPPGTPPTVIGANEHRSPDNIRTAAFQPGDQGGTRSKALPRRWPLSHPDPAIAATRT